MKGGKRDQLYIHVSLHERGRRGEFNHVKREKERGDRKGPHLLHRRKRRENFRLRSSIPRSSLPARYEMKEGLRNYSLLHLLLSQIHWKEGEGGGGVRRLYLTASSPLRKKKRKNNSIVSLYPLLLVVYKRKRKKKKRKKRARDAAASRSSVVAHETGRRRKGEGEERSACGRYDLTC